MVTAREAAERDLGKVAEQFGKGDRKGAVAGLVGVLVGFASGSPLAGGLTSGALTALATALLDTAEKRMVQAGFDFDLEQERVRCLGNHVVEVVMPLLTEFSSHRFDAVLHQLRWMSEDLAKSQEIRDVLAFLEHLARPIPLAGDWSGEWLAKLHPRSLVVVQRGTAEIAIHEDGTVDGLLENRSLGPGQLVGVVAPAGRFSGTYWYGGDDEATIGMNGQLRLTAPSAATGTFNGHIRGEAWGRTTFRLHKRS